MRASFLLKLNLQSALYWPHGADDPLPVVDYVKYDLRTTQLVISYCAGERELGLKTFAGIYNYANNVKMVHLKYLT